MKLWTKIFIGLIFGALFGFILGPKAVFLKPIGTVFIHLIKMLIVPLVFSSLVVGMISISDVRKVGRVGLKSFCFYLVSTAIAISIGLMFGSLFQPGSGLELSENISVVAAKESPSLIDTLVNIVPSNPVFSMSSGNILQIIFFSIFVGFINYLNRREGETFF